MYNKLMIAGITLALGLTACNQFKTSETGVEYKMHTSNKGDLIVTDNYVNMSMKYYGVDSAGNDTLLFENDNIGLMVSEHTFEGDLMDALKLCTVNDSMTFNVHADSLIVKTFGLEVPEFLDGEKPIRFEIKVKEVTSRAELMKKLDEEKSAQIGKEKEIVAEYIAKNKLKADSTGSGLMYVVNKKGFGAKPAVGDTVMVHYTGKLMDGTVFDSSKDREAIKFPLGVGMVIRGWDEGLALLTKGTKATFIVPSHLAYGPGGAGNGVIPPNATLVFDVELVNVIPAK
jgi:FKBP-type peptidyl-prolyl cis-trans isomerase FkpA